MLSFHALLFILIVIFFFLLRSSYAKEKLTELKPSNAIIGCTGCYAIITTTAVLSYIGKDFIYWYTLQFAAGFWLIGYAIVSKKEVPSWEITRLWLIGALFCLPINLLWHWWRVTDYPFLLKLSLAHLAVILALFPLSLGVITLAAMLLAITYVFCSLGSLIELTDDIISLFGFSVLIFIMIIYIKIQIADYRAHNRYLKNKAKRKQERHYKVKLKQTAHSLHIHATEGYSERETIFLQKIVEEVMESSLFLEDDYLYKEDFGTIVSKFTPWSIFLKQHAKSKVHLPLLPTEIGLDELVQQLEIALNDSVKSAPKLVITQKNVDLAIKIVCDVGQIIDLLTSIILRAAHLDQAESIRIQLHTTRLKYYKYGPIKKQRPPEINFPAIALVIGNADAPLDTLPSIRTHYEDITEGIEVVGALNQAISERVNVQKQPIERMIRAHYGYLQFPSSKQKATLLVLPCNVTTIRDEMIHNIIPSNSFVTKSEMDASMTVFMKFNDYVCKMCDIRIGVMDEIFLLLRRCYAFRRHASGELFYVRAVGIARLVVDWVAYAPEPIYAALLYDLIVYTDLPLSYIKANYSLDIFCFVQSIVSIEERQDIEPSGLYVDDQRNKVVNRDQLFVLCIKLAERLYDLRHAYGYAHKIQVIDMAKETLTVDICLAKKYLDGDIVEALEAAAQEVLQVCLEKG
ncbi:MAG: HD domain-containing protein [Candidatus Cardinium sp.]|uniref:HD domain-containing protein n=1 Tax=Cardinium endosymbiont of Dermatophagoides farinae TaxID=2597823 RepID=UPI0011830207|nr:HD domain-containing protein [Cardinium endosymbiont of Dermatophagoides farinae]TSJ81074.1 HD domain-containing protein [Cardinium endosymbiont of Dermatophagoides farinae]UWW97109.1 MAG: HD domain-containing protein [Candidatus Cardinium sp.]